MIPVIELSVFASRLNAICVEMGASLRRSAFSPNIKDRLDYSCALFDVAGLLCAQAAHIPVHLGSMAYAMKDIVKAFDWQHGDVLIVNDPYLGGTHLPDVTIVSPVFVADTLIGFVANRAHHANVGASSPGSMPIATRLEEEGAVIPPTLLVRDGSWDTDVLAQLTGLQTDREQSPKNTMSSAVKAQNYGDFYAQVSACELGVRRACTLVERTGIADFNSALQQLNLYAESLALSEWSKIPNGIYDFTDYMDGDGISDHRVTIKVVLTVRDGTISADFDGTSAQTPGNINCPLSVAAAAVFYVFRCLLPNYAPACAGTFKPIRLKAPVNSVVNASRPAAVAAGNVETSSRIVDAVLGALAIAMPGKIPAASQGTMNNLAMGNVKTSVAPAWDYYETLGGGGGAGPAGCGASGLQTHMTNTLNTPVESIEQHFPVRIRRYQLRNGSGGVGEYSGGDGVIREFEFTASAKATLLTERRSTAVWGVNGAAPGKCGLNLLNGEPLPAKVELSLEAGDTLTLCTPGGGGWNSPG